MDEFRQGLLVQMGANRSRARARREPWLYGVGATCIGAGLCWYTGAILLPTGLFVLGWGLTVFRNARLNGREGHRLLGQALTLAGAIVLIVSAWRAAW